MIEDRFLTRQVQYFSEAEKRWITAFERVPVQIRFMDTIDETGGRWHLEPGTVSLPVEAEPDEVHLRIADADKLDAIAESKR